MVSASRPPPHASRNSRDAVAFGRAGDAVRVGAVEQSLSRCQLVIRAISLPCREPDDAVEGSRQVLRPQQRLDGEGGGEDGRARVSVEAAAGGHAGQLPGGQQVRPSRAACRLPAGRLQRRVAQPMHSVAQGSASSRSGEIGPRHRSQLP